MSSCKVFIPFEISPDVCDECGKPADYHEERRADMLPYKEAVWKYLLKAGGTYSYYGGYGYDSQDIRDHVQECGLDFDKMNTPEMDTVSEFAGTFASNSDEVAVVKGVIYCKCGKPPVQDQWRLHYSKGAVDWILRDASLGEIIWHVVKTGEIKE